MKLIEAISLRIKELMQERNITQYRLGQVCNIPHTTLSNIFCSICKSVNMDIIVKICKGLGISLKEFFRGEAFELQNLEVD